MNMIERISWENVDSGNLVGAMVYRVVVGEGPHDIVEAIARIRSHGVGKLVCFAGDFTLENSDEMFTLVKSLYDMGYGIAALSNGKIYFPWFTLVTYLIVTTATAWPGFKVQELRWQRADLHACMPANPDTCNLFVEDVPERLLGFLKEHGKEKWRMLFHTKVISEEVL
jgi:hypothetical protein